MMGNSEMIKEMTMTDWRPASNQRMMIGAMATMGTVCRKMA
jgi:hypothetical protein